MSLAKEASKTPSQERRERRKRSYQKLASWQQDLHHIKRRLRKDASWAEKAASASEKQPQKPRTLGDAYRGGKK